jgi:hypothetical protein
VADPVTAAQRRLFLSELAVSGNLAFACHAASVSRREAYSARERYLGFEKEWRRAERLAFRRSQARQPLAK